MDQNRSSISSKKRFPVRISRNGLVQSIREDLENATPSGSFFTILIISLSYKNDSRSSSKPKEKLVTGFNVPKIT